MRMVESINNPIQSEQSVIKWRTLILASCITVMLSLPVLAQNNSADINQTQSELEDTKAKREALLLENRSLKQKEQDLADEVERLKTQQDEMQDRRDELERQRESLMREMETSSDQDNSEPQSTQIGVNEPFVIINQTPPVYPDYAAEDRVEGYVDLEFMLAVDGQISDIRILESVPLAVFDESSIKAVKQWQIVNNSGKTIKITDRLEYKIDAY